MLTSNHPGIYPDTVHVMGTTYLPTDTTVEILVVSELIGSGCRPGTGAASLRIEAMSVEATQEFEPPFELVTQGDL